MSTLQIGLNLPTYSLENGTCTRWTEMRHLALLTEQAGVDTLWVPDHLLRRVASRDMGGFWECWTVLSALAEATSRITIGPFVACTAFRQPALLAKMADTLDEVSGGRVILALGAGVPKLDGSWHAFGYSPDHPAGRFEEALEIIARLFREGELSFSGQYYTVNNATIAPRGPRKYGPPIWVAAKGPRTTKLVAKWADALNINMMLAGPQDLLEQFRMLEEACQELGRNPAEVARTGYCRVSFVENAAAAGTPAYTISGNSSEIAQKIFAIHKAGISHLTLYVDSGHAQDAALPYPVLTPKSLDLLSPVLDELHKLVGTEKEIIDQDYRQESA